MPGAKHWCFTSYAETVVYDESKMLYLLFGVESCPKTGRRHLQGFVSFKNRTTLVSAKKALNDPSAHLEIKSRNSTIQEATDYCKKEGNFEEHGVMPDEQTVGLTAANQKRKFDYEEADRLAREGNYEEISSELRIKHWSNLVKIREYETRKRDVSDIPSGSICGLWLFGAPGLGKSYFARDFCRQRGLAYYVKAKNKWWDGYQDEPVVIIEDLDDFDAKHMGPKIKEWADEYPFPAETKGGSIKIRPKLLVITTNYDFHELWPNDVTLQEAIKRRFFAPPLIRREDFGEITCPENLSIHHGVQEEIRQASSSSTEIPS